MTYQLGIDTGGTYTDAVIVDAQQHVVVTHKSLTTAFDLTVGIGNAISAMPAELLNQIDLVALSTTLSTNSVVEGRGAPVSVLLPGYTEQQVVKSGLYDILEADRIALLTGGHNATGSEVKALDLQTIEQVILEQSSKVSAFAVSAMFGTRNSAHELAIRDLVNELSGKPVACGHELASSLGAPRRALTAALNARMILHIKSLISSVEIILAKMGIEAPLMIVKSDGSLVNVKTALQQPVATVLSGPAASVIGACALSDQRNALVVDIGGTTTDIAIVSDGQPELCEDGAHIGDWQPMVEAIRVFSIGLGGDSEVRFNGAITISQRRVVPVSLLAYQYPHIIALLEKQWSASPNPRHNRFALRLQYNDVLISQLNADESRAWQALETGPIEIDALADTDRSMTRALARLERLGLVIYSGFTPSDATHVLGLSDHWNRRAAELGALLWARQMRHLYGYGDWPAGDATAPCRQVFDLVTREISIKLIEAGLNQHGKLNEAKTRSLTELIADIVLRANREQQQSPLFDLQFAQNYPIVAVGGPAADYFPEVARQLDVELHLPKHAETANAIGAVMGAVIQVAHITVTQPEFGIFYVFHKDQPQTFNNLEEALVQARSIALTTACELAMASGAESVVTRLRESADHVKHDIDGELFVTATITAIATGRPSRGITRA